MIVSLNLSMLLCHHCDAGGRLHGAGIEWLETKIGCYASTTKYVSNTLEYIEKWHVMLWDKAFKPMICVDPPFIKGSKLREVKVGKLGIKRVLYKLVHMTNIFPWFHFCNFHLDYILWHSYTMWRVWRYVWHEPLSKKTIVKEPTMCSPWIEKSNTNFMCTRTQLKATLFNILEICP